MGDVQLEYDLETYVDADYAHKAEDRRSVSGVAVSCGGTLVSWFSRTQKCVTLSTTEAEYVAVADGVKEALYVRGVLVFLMPSLGSPSIGVFEDNKGAIDLAKNPLSSSNSKHIDVRYHFLRELVGKGDLCVKYRINMRTFSPRRLLGRVLRNTVTFCWGYKFSVVNCFWELPVLLEAC